MWPFQQGKQGTNLGGEIALVYFGWLQMHLALDYCTLMHTLAASFDLPVV
jgi:hypothetical protein